MTATEPAESSGSTPPDGPVAVVRRYLDELYHAGDVELVREITADGVVRHDPGGTRVLDQRPRQPGGLRTARTWRRP